MGGHHDGTNNNNKGMMRNKTADKSVLIFEHVAKPDTQPHNGILGHRISLGCQKFSIGVFTFWILMVVGNLTKKVSSC